MTLKTRHFLINQLIYYCYEPIDDKCVISAGSSNHRSSFKGGPALRDNVLGLV